MDEVIEVTTEMLLHGDRSEVGKKVLIANFKRLINYATLDTTAEARDRLSSLFSSWTIDQIWDFVFRDYNHVSPNSSLCFYTLMLLLNSVSNHHGVLYNHNSVIDAVLLLLVSSDNEDNGTCDQVSNFDIGYTFVCKAVTLGYVRSALTLYRDLSTADCVKLMLLLSICEQRLAKCSDSSEERELYCLVDGIFLLIDEFLETRAQTKILESNEIVLPVLTELLNLDLSARLQADDTVNLARSNLLLSHLRCLDWLNNNVPRVTPKLALVEVPEIYQRWHGVKRDVIRNLSLLLANNRMAQDLIDSSYPEYLLLVLEHTQYDDLNPYVREYSVLAIKHLLNGHAKLQEKVKSLEYRGAESFSVK